MSKPYWSGTGTRGGNTYADESHHSTDSDGHSTESYRSSYKTLSDKTSAYKADGTYDTYDTGATEILDYEDYDDYDDFEHDRDTRWRWIAGAAAAVLFVSVVSIATVLGNDSATSTATSTQTSAAEAPVQDAAPTSTTPRTVIATVPPGPGPSAPLAPETVVTVTTTPSATHPSPAELPPPPPVEGVAPERIITYSVTGNRQLFDLVTVIYTDEQGFPRTDLNVALPWSRTVVLNPGVETQSVTATSVTGQLNCTITDATGAVTVAQGNNSLIATCTK